MEIEILQADTATYPEDLKKHWDYTNGKQPEYARLHSDYRFVFGTASALVVENTE